MRQHNYQLAGTGFLVDRLYRNPGAGLWFDPGLGKTSVTLHALDALQFDGIRKVLLIAPARVLWTSWPQEITDWGFDHSMALLEGSMSARKQILDSNPDILCLTSEGCGSPPKKFKDPSKTPVPNVMDWLTDTGYRPDIVVIDESTKFKNWSAHRSKRLRKFLSKKKVQKRIALTGTPVPNGLNDIFSQQFLLDSGKTLGSGIGKFRDQFCYRGGYENREWIFDESKQAELEGLIAPWYLRTSAVGHLDLPQLLTNVIRVALPPAAKSVYKQMEQEMYAELDGGQTVLAFTGGAKYNLCRQIASGAAYAEDGTPISVHSAKLDALEDLNDELGGKQLLVAYCFRHELMRIQSRFPKVAVVSGDTSKREFLQVMEGWKSGRIQMLAVQCQAMSHGVNGLQKTGCEDICWFSQTDDPEIHTQLIARVCRQGNTASRVRVHYLVAVGTVDVAIKRGLEAKDITQQSVMDAVKLLRTS